MKKILKISGSSPYGSELVNPSNWVVEANWSVLDGDLTANGTNGGIYQAIPGLTPGVDFKVTFTVTGGIGNYCQIRFGDRTTTNTTFTAAGDYDLTLTANADATEQRLRFYSVGWTGTILNLSVRKIL